MYFQKRGCARGECSRMQEEGRAVPGSVTEEPHEFIEKLKQKYVMKLHINIDEIESKISERNEAKKNKNFDKADEIRNDLDKKGIVLMDTSDGTTWNIKKLM